MNSTGKDVAIKEEESLSSTEGGSAHFPCICWHNKGNKNLYIIQGPNSKDGEEVFRSMHNNVLREKDAKKKKKK